LRELVVGEAGKLHVPNTKQYQLTEKVLMATVPWINFMGFFCKTK
jgi:hypothetical protein